MDTTSSLTLSTSLIAHRLQRLENVVVIDMREVATWDYFVVATVSGRKAMSDSVAALREIAKQTGSSWRIEGADDWTLVDLGTHIVHLFTPQGRRTWRLDQLWGMLPQESVQAEALAGA
jgi:ribosome-associated protein